MDLVHKLVGRTRKSKPTPLCPFLFHLYDSQGHFIDEEETDYRATQELTNYKITLDPEPEFGPVSEEEVEEIKAPKQPMQQLEEEWLLQRPNRLKRMKHTYPAPEESPPVQSRGEESRQHPNQPQAESQPELQPDQTELD